MPQMPPAQRDYYEVLGVERGATDDQIRAAYRRLARKLHPDVNKATDATQKFAEVQQAYDILSDAQKRKTYDQFGHAPPAGYAHAGGPQRAHYTWTNVAGPGGVGTGEAEFDVGSIFEEMFGRAGAGGGGGFEGVSGRARSRSRTTRGRDLESELAVEFMEALRGGKNTIRLQRGGKTQAVEVTIPPGVEDGAKLRIRGMGATSTTNGPPGDLILTVRVAPHSHFRREGLDLLLDLPLSIAEATLGTKVSVPTVNGRAEVTVPPGTPSGQRLRLRGQGVKTEDGRQGDLYVLTRIITPRELSPEDRKLLEDLGKRLPPVRKGPPWE